MSAPTARMIGRDGELAVLRTAFASAQSGTPSVVVVRGEAGIGKTRLLQEFRAELQAPVAEGPPVALAVGQCVDMGEIGSPFTPIRRLLRELYAAVGDEAFRTAARTPAVIATLSTLLPELASDAAAPIGSDSDYLSESIERLIETLSHEHHLVLIIEDLHWADAATLSLLKTLAVTLRGAHVTVVMTYRSDDVGRGHPLRPVLAELDRNRSVTGIELSRLTPDETAALARATPAGRGTASIDQVIARSEGVPFFVEELVELGDAALPDTLRDLVLARFERLGDAARRVVGLVSAGGVHVDSEALEAVHDGDRDDLHAALREALETHVLVADADGYAFRHALIQEAVHDDLLPSERAEHHRRFAAVLQQRVDAGRTEWAAQTAEHWQQARDLPRTFDALVTARQHAQRSFAPLTAARLGEQMLELWPQIPGAAERASTGLLDLYLDIVMVWRLHDSPRVIRLVDSALAADPDDRLGAARLLAEAAGSHGNDGRMSDAMRTAERAHALLEEDDPAHATVIARILGITSTLPGSLLGSEDTRWQLADTALAMAERGGDTEALSTCLTNISWPLIDTGRFDEALTMIRRTHGLDLTHASRLHATITETDVLTRMGRYDEVVAVADAAIAIAGEVGLERSFGAHIAANEAEALIARGDAAQGVSVAERCVELFAGVATFRSFTLRLLALAAAWADEQGEARRRRAQDAEVIAALEKDDPEERIGWAEYDAEAALNLLEDASDAAAARTLADAALTAALVLDDDDFRDGPGSARRILPAAARALAAAARAGAGAADAARLREVLARALAAQPDDGPRRALLALAAAEDAGSSEAVAAWDEAVARCAEGLVPVRHLHYARYRLAQALVASGTRDRASEVIDEITRTAPRDGAGIVARWAHALAARAGMETAAGLTPPAASGLAGLTPRERQVLALVAEGLTNPQIGARLFISPKTASVHVSAILAKIGATNRAEAAALFAAAP